MSTLPTNLRRQLENAIMQAREIAEGGHMAPLTRPDVVNPIVRSFLSAPLGADEH